MDPISIVVAAVVAGAASGFGAVATDSIKDAYHALKKHLRRQYGWDSDVNRAIEEVERELEAGKPILRAALENSPETLDGDTLAAASQVNKLTVKQVATIATDARVSSSGLEISGLSREANADLTQGQNIAERAEVRDSPITIKFSDS